MGRVLSLAKWVGIVVGFILSYGPLYFDAQESEELGLPWETWLGIGLTVLIASFCSIIYGLWRENSEFKKRSQPKVVFDGFNDNPHQTQTVSSVDYDTGEVYQRFIPAEFRRARFVNQPAKKGQGADANNLYARIQFLNESGECKLLEVHDGRWADLPEVRQSGINIKCIDLSASGESATLDIATKGHGENECYGWNNSGRVGPGLQPGTYQVHVELRVANPDVDDKHFWFALTNPGKDGLMNIREREGFANECSREWMAMKSIPSTEASENQEG